MIQRKRHRLALVSLFSALGLFLFLLGCDTNGSEQEPTLARAELTLVPASGLGFEYPSIRFNLALNAEASASSDTLKIFHGTSYEGFLKFFDDAGSTATFSISGAAENSQVFYRIDGIPSLDLRVTDKESDYGSNTFGDDLPVGLGYLLASQLGSQGGEGRLHIQVVDFPSQVKNGQNANGGNTVADFTIPLVIQAVPGPNLLHQPITRAIITMEPLPNQSDTVVRVATASNPAGLHLGTATADSLKLMTTTQYRGRIQFFDDQADKEITDAIQADANYYQIVYNIFLPDSPGFGRLELDQDANGLPLGLEFTFVLPNGSSANGIRSIQLYQYDPNLGEQKDGIRLHGRVVLEILLPFKYDYFF